MAAFLQSTLTSAKKQGASLRRNPEKPHGELPAPQTPNKESLTAIFTRALRAHSLRPPQALPPEPTTEVVESKLISCERCGVKLAMLIFAPGATDAGRFEDYARKMYSEYARLNVQTWIIGPALGGGPLMERPADMLKVWPVREPLYRQPPAPFNAMLDRLTSEHCQ